MESIFQTRKEAGFYQCVEKRERERERERERDDVDDASCNKNRGTMSIKEKQDERKS